MFIKDRNKLMLLFIIIMMCIMGLVCTDIYIPALPVIADAFGVKAGLLQQSLSAYFLGLAISQLVYGPLSERFGRKPIVLMGIAIFTIASFSIMFAPNVHTILIARFFQAVGACAGMTIGRAIIGEIYTKEETGKIFATVFPFIGLSPAIAPVIGGFIYHSLGWRAIFAFVGALGLLLILLIYVKLPETKDTNARISIHPKAISKAYLELISNRVFWGYTLCPCFAYIAYFAYMAESPFIFTRFAYSTQAISFFYISLSVSYVIGNLTARKLLAKFSLSQVLSWGYYGFAFGGICMVVLNYHLNQNQLLFDLIFPSTILTLGNGFLLPLGSAGVITQFPKNSGYASAMLGFLQLGAASLSTTWIGSITQADPFKLALYIMVATVLGLFLYLFLIIKPLKEKEVS